MKILLSLLTSSMLITTPFLSLSTAQLIKLYSNLRGSPFHPDIKISTTDENKNSQSGDLDHSVKETYPGYTSINWTNYANNWEQFKQYYKTITLYTSGYADGKSASKQNFGNTYITVANIEQRSTWHDNSTLRASGSLYCLAYTSHNFQWGSYDQSGVYYDAIVSGSLIQLRFYLWTKGYQYGSGSIWTEAYIKYSGGVISSSWSLNTIKNNLNNALSNTINLVSDYSGSLIDKQNIIDPTGKNNDETSKLNAVISNVLSNEYNDWKQYIQPYSFSDSTRKATTVFKFPDPVTSQQIVWTFETPINIILSADYWTKELSQRLHILPGQVVNPTDSTKGMVTDTPDQLAPADASNNYGGKWRYHTSVGLEFDAVEQAPDGTVNPEWVEVNGVKIQVLDNKFIATLVDNRVAGDTVNTYAIAVHHKDKSYDITYTIDIVIETLVPDLKLKWYAWDPAKNPDQNNLITPTLPDGKPNPKYDKEINKDTGTKTQIVWIRHKSDVSTPLDPLNKNGEVIDPTKNPEDYDLGFIAEGSVSGMGVNQTFNDSNITSVYREGVKPSDLIHFTNPTDRQKNTQIISDNFNQYWADTGIWHYATTMSDQTTAQKFVVIGPEYQNKYPRFLDVVSPEQAVEFWTTIHGVHLKNYLATYKGLDSTTISKLSYEQVMAYWKEYTSDVIAQKIPPDPTPANYQDISGTIDTLKMNETDVNVIKNAIIKKVNSYVSSFTAKAVLGADYVIKTSDGKDITIDPSGLEPLLNDQTEPQYLTISINSLPTSTLLIGNATLTVRNSSHYDPTTAKDLSKIKWEDYTYNFAGQTPQQLRDWLLKNNDNYFKQYGYESLVLNTDYGITGNKIPTPDPNTHHNTPGNLSDQLLASFLDNSTGIKTLTIIIYADDATDLAVGQSQFTLTNDPGSTPVPPDPPVPPTPKPNYFDNKANIIWVTLVVLITVIGGILIGFVIYHKKRKRIK